MRSRHRLFSAAALAGAFLLACAAPGLASAEPRRQLIAAHATDPALSEDDWPNLVVEDPAAPPGPLLIWLPGSNGHPANSPPLFFETAVQQGYRVLGIAYVTTPAVGQVCVGARLRAQPDCAARFRQQRVWGDAPTSLIKDRPAEAIVPRLTHLLQYLAANDPAGQWAQYLDGAEPRWSRLVLAGQSQGGGMAAFLAQSRRVGGVLMFSGGWDRGPDGIADWYHRPSQTPPERWQATYHVNEPTAATLAEIARAHGLAPAQIHALDLPVAGRMAHTEGIGNPAYRPLWQQMLTTLAAPAP